MGSCCGGVDGSGAAWLSGGWFGIGFAGDAGLVQADGHDGVADTEVVGECGEALSAVDPGVLQEAFGYEGASGEVVGGPLRQFFRRDRRADPLGVYEEPPSVAVADDVVELVEGGESLPRGWVSCVDRDDPAGAVPVAHATHG